MNRDDVIRMAREAGMEQDGDNFFSPSHEEIDVHIDDLERFAAAAFAAGAAAENEACAKVADQGAKYNRYVSKQISIAIRARRKT